MYAQDDRSACVFTTVFPQGFNVRDQETPLHGVTGSFNKLGVCYRKEVNPLSTNRYCTRHHLEVFFFRKKSDISFELSASRTIHMKCQVLFSLKNKINFRMSSATICIVLYG